MTADGASQQRRAVGRIVRPVGVRGEVKVMPLTDDAERFQKLNNVTMGLTVEEAVAVRFERARRQGNAFVVKLACVDTVEAAEQCRGQYLFVEQQRSARPRPGGYLVDEVIGCEVVTVAGRVVGTVQEILSMPANDVWVVRDGTKEYLLPAVRALLRSVDVTRKRIEVEDLEGLFE
jgi:16S rRNA processing protein RimM